MRKVQLNRINPGEKLARPIFREDGNVLLGAGMPLSERFIQRLQDLGIDSVYIEDALTDGIEPNETLRDDTRKNAAEAIHKLMATQMDHPGTKGRAALPEMGRTFRAVFNEILNDVMTRKDIFAGLSQMHTHDSYLFHHSVNVAVLAGIIGIAKGYNRNQLEDLGMGAMLFDIGMTRVPRELLNKKGPFTMQEREIMQRHTTDGYDLLRKQHDLSLLSAHCALQHHERYDGSGYPRGIRQNEIHEYAQIVAISDVFDALTSSRPYRKRYTPSEAIEFMFAAGNTYFDLELVRLFCSHISMYPVSTSVVLSSGQVCVVARNFQVAVHRPVVRVIREADGTVPAEPYEVDLRDQLHLTIIREV
ncbi:HD-GYP domain-containing protein [Paenibacillus herberti]|uniref:Metal-dependent phosphohydrolase n=1 Tax=Paenibacillus herberti TaxID=1619309 RepID=A0A229NTH0_9BACL|nr:HD-GYP domain-containing protein [Paenibacillus herberti]OXM13146.1 metal-dependent phosphohydrolase [Paenibacillus herberti]